MAYPFWLEKRVSSRGPTIDTFRHVYPMPVQTNPGSIGGHSSDMLRGSWWEFRDPVGAAGQKGGCACPGSPFEGGVCGGRGRHCLNVISGVSGSSSGLMILNILR